jgi:hypothetical protein
MDALAINKTQLMLMQWSLIFKQLGVHASGMKERLQIQIDGRVSIIPEAFVYLQWIDSKKAQNCLKTRFQIRNLANTQGDQICLRKSHPKCCQTNFYLSWYISFVVEKSSPKIWATSVIFENLPKVNNRSLPLVENSPNLFTLLETPDFLLNPRKYMYYYVVDNLIVCVYL